MKMLFDINSLAGPSLSRKSGAALQTPGNRFIVRICKVETPIEKAFPSLEKGFDYPFSTSGGWSTHDLIFRCLDIIGPARLFAATWSAGQEVTQLILNKMTDGTLKEIHCLADIRVKVNNPDFVALAKQSFTSFRISAVHAKIFTLQNDEWSISCVSSANWTHNPRIEAGHLSTNKQVADFHTDWIRREIQGKEPFGQDVVKVAKFYKQ
uniref:PLD-like domain-containing protein n=1 Tax=Candidatus Kentrum sp. LPFa TaxID=2126335 RepID=A0A450Y0Y7_9GAMM|nr:MAG: hypothetical protein BECKLPF1236A_GA0070988_103594 [Candidatus Kentron sp. LPFa]VFK35193.1 MAG: hypothetical protein BECKLPF1236C_GA0070990_103434 [Candidatus Kentron sp. LPFa]